MCKFFLGGYIDFASIENTAFYTFEFFQLCNREPLKFLNNLYFLKLIIKQRFLTNQTLK